MEKLNKIISMSVWGNEPRYIIGAKRQIELSNKYYPEWNIRIYTDNINNFVENEKLKLYYINNNSYGMFWRFLPMFENENNITMVRDSDSRITIREKMCIDKWINSDKKFHTFKDHDAHYEFPIIGCSFAFKGKFSDDICNIMLEYMHNQKYYLSDQFFLRDYIYPIIKNNIMLHEMNSGWFGETRKRLKNKYSFCGNGYDENDMPLYPDTLDNINKFDKNNISEKYRFDEGVLIDE